MSSTPVPISFTRTASDIAAEVLMIKAGFGGAVVLVEGPTDSRLFSRHLDLQHVQLTICGGKAPACGAMALLAATATSGYLAVVDRDYDDHNGILPAPNTFYTDTHDTETLMLAHRLETILLELGESSKIMAFEISSGSPIQNAVLERSEIFARLRYVSSVAPGLNTPMEGMSPWKYIDLLTWAVDELRLHTDFATSCGRSLQDVMAFVGAAPAMRNWRDVQGHDSIAILLVGLKGVLGSGRQIGEERLMSSLRLAFSEADFRATKLHADLANWEFRAALKLLKS